MWIGNLTGRMILGKTKTKTRPWKSYPFFVSLDFFSEIRPQRFYYWNWRGHLRSGALSGSPEAQDSLVLGGEGEQFSLIASDGTTLRCSRKTWTHLLTETLEQDHLVFQDLEGSCQVRRKAFEFWDWEKYDKHSCSDPWEKSSLIFFSGLRWQLAVKRCLLPDEKHRKSCAFRWLFLWLT